MKVRYTVYTKRSFQHKNRYLIVDNRTGSWADDDQHTCKADAARIAAEMNRADRAQVRNITQA